MLGCGMAEIISLRVATERRDEDVNTVFAEYVAAKQKLDTTMRAEDAIAAAKVWKRFLELFCGPF